MNEHERPVGATDVDELWLGDWVAEGIDAFERYLVKQAAFAVFLAERDGRSQDDGNGAVEH